MQPATVLEFEETLSRGVVQEMPVSGTAGWSFSPAFGTVELFADALTVLCGVQVLYEVARTRLHYPEMLAGNHLWAFCIGVALLIVLNLERTGTYRSSGSLLRIRETAVVLEACFLSFVIAVPGAYVLGSPKEAWLLVFAIPLLAVMLVIEKQVLHSIFDVLRQKGYGVRRVLIYGAGACGKSLYSALIRSPKQGLLPVAIIDDGTGENGVQVHASSYRRERFLTSAAAVFRASLVRAHQADMVIVASRNLPKAAVDAVVSESRLAGASVAFAADFDCDGIPSMDYIDLDGQIIYSMHMRKPALLQRAAMRALDVAVSSAVMVVIAPLLGILALAVKLDSDGPALFRQQRVGRDGRRFVIYKFRTMHTNLCVDDVSPMSSVDPRITRCGRWLRKTSLDELPQLINVLKNDMSLVGPRPEMPFIVSKYTTNQRRRLTVKPGVTGLWQISADRRFPIHENLQYDLYYIKHQSVFINFAVLIHTALFAMQGT
ncbi:MAG: exopolysaccharide biosynthesis polyprenyl glycosylphosphotransferase [Acidobacteriaceae bacterium]